MPAKQLRFALEARNRMVCGIDVLANAVRVTLGPKGRNVVLEKSYGAPRITKDGVTVAKDIEVADKFGNMGVQLVREVASRASYQAGDGTTTATVLAHAIVREGAKLVAAGANPMDLKRGIDAAVEAVVADLRRNSKSVTLNEEIAQIGRIAANGDVEIGGFLAQAMRQVGNDGVITVEEGKTSETMLEVIEGMQFDRGYISSYFVTNANKMRVELDEPYVLIHEKKLSNLNEMLPLLDAVMESETPLLVIAENVEGEVLTTLVANKLRGSLKVAAIKGYCRRANVEKVDAGPKGVVISFRDNKFAQPDRLVYFIRQHGQAAKVRPDMKVVFLQEWETPEERLMGTTEILRQLANLAENKKAA